MANSTKDIRRRIKSINNTRKITKAMEMVSAAKMRRSVASVTQIREYAHSAWGILTHLAAAFSRQGKGLLSVREVRNILMIVVSSNRGLCGSYNAQINKKLKYELANKERLKISRITEEMIKSEVSDSELKIDFITVGKKSENTIRKMGYEIIATFPNLAYLPKIEDVRPLARIIIDDYLEKKYDKVVIIYTDYVSPVVQQPKIRQILPVSQVDIEKQLAEMDIHAQEYGLKEKNVEYMIEPTPSEVLTHIFPRLIEMQIYHAVLESNASKESARMMAMRNATDAAGEMASGLTLAYNQIRQSKITQEIAEISAGAAALSQ